MDILEQIEKLEKAKKFAERQGNANAVRVYTNKIYALDRKVKEMQQYEKEIGV